MDITRVFLVFDIANASYDTHKGHLPEENDSPIVIVRFGGSSDGSSRGGEKVQAYAANGLTRKKANSDVARAHNDHGVDSFPPFKTHFTLGGPVCLDPRDPALLL